MWISGQLKKFLGVMLTTWCLSQGTVAFGVVVYSVTTVYWSWNGPGGVYGITEVCNLTDAFLRPPWVTHLAAGPLTFELPVQASVVLGVLLGVLCMVSTVIFFVCLWLSIRRYKMSRRPRRQAHDLALSH